MTGSNEIKVKREDITEGASVWYWFDTGAFGHTILEGVVEKVSPKTFVVRWESGLVQRLSFEKHLHHLRPPK